MKKIRDLYEGEYLNENDSIKYSETKYSFFEKLHIDLPIEQMTRNTQREKYQIKNQSIEIEEQIEPQSESLPQQIPFEKPHHEDIFTFTMHSNKNQMLGTPPN